jgi:crotonobetainyl-CoA:carnitine CoA-transferase CaiB-like acyl-CoA transferase
MWRQLLGEMRAAAGDAEPPPAELTVTGEPGHLPSHLPVEDTALACTATALLGAARLNAARRIALDRAHVAAAYRSEAHVRVNGQPAPAGFAPLSGFWRARDGWIRTHANYPWHREALLRTLGAPDDKAAVAAAVAERDARELEDAIVADGGVAAAMRTREQWLAEPPGQQAAGAPLVTTRRDGDAEPRRGPAAACPSGAPAAGIKVLDLTRVIAGPVCTRYLAALGADVLRIDPPHLPELPRQAVDSLLGKRSAILDAATATLHELLGHADVLVHGYRPHALDRFGLTPDALAARHPGLVTVSLSAWGAEGPWGNRRGFDSIVQVASGIAAAESPDGDRPGALPCQLLDHGTGYLCAAAALSSLAAQRAAGGTHSSSLSLSRTANLLLSAPRRQAPRQAPRKADPPLVTVPGPDGDVTVVPPPGELDGVPLAWPRALSRYGSDAPSWE